VAVAAGLVSFALGTDTAGSGRVPAAFNNIVGLKPTRGLLSTRGVVPACRSLDCVSVFALTARDASVVFDAAARFDPDDPLAREPDAGQSPRFGARLRFAVPPSKDLEFFGDTEAAFLFEQAIANLERIGGSRTEVAFATFRNAGRLLYEAPGWPSACMRPEHFSKKTRIQSFRWSVRLSRKAGTTVRSTRFAPNMNWPG
jgi:allophanate hydrolase